MGVFVGGIRETAYADETTTKTASTPPRHHEGVTRRAAGFVRGAFGTAHPWPFLAVSLRFLVSGFEPCMLSPREVRAMERGAPVFREAHLTP
jgi:hypothetical protein